MKSRACNLSAWSNQHHNVLATGNVGQEGTSGIIRLHPLISHATTLYNPFLKNIVLHLKSNWFFAHIVPVEKLLPGLHSYGWKWFNFLLISIHGYTHLLFCQHCPAAFLLVDIYPLMLHINQTRFSSQSLLFWVKQSKFFLSSFV